MRVKRDPIIIIAAALLIGASAGCALKEAAKKVIGNSTQTLEEQARTNGVSRSYQCSYQDCFQAVEIMARQKPSNVPWEKLPNPNEGDFDILMSDPYADPPYIIVVGVEGNINTTEVGIFFTRVTKDAINVSISSLASTAKRTVAKLVFAQLDQHFQKVE